MLYFMKYLIALRGHHNHFAFKEDLINILTNCVRQLNFSVIVMNQALCQYTFQCLEVDIQ